MSILSIKQYLTTALIAAAFYGIVIFGIRIKYFNSAREWPSQSKIMAFVIAGAAYMYIIVMTGEDINIYIKYIILVSALIIYVLIHTNANKKLKV